MLTLRVLFTALQAFNGSRKAKGIASNATNKTASGSSSSAATLSRTSDEDSTEDGNESPSSDGKVRDKLEELEIEASLRSQVRTMRTGPGRKAKGKKGANGADDEGKTKKKGKQMTKWDDSKLSKKEISALNRSTEVRV